MTARAYGDARLHESPQEAARAALLPDDNDPSAPDVVARIDSFERQTYMQGWCWGFLCGAVAAAAVAGTVVMGWAAWAH